MALVGAALQCSYLVLIRSGCYHPPCYSSRRMKSCRTRCRGGAMRGNGRGRRLPLAVSTRASARSTWSTGYALGHAGHSPSAMASASLMSRRPRRRKLAESAQHARHGREQCPFGDGLEQYRAFVVNVFGIVRVPRDVENWRTRPVVRAMPATEVMWSAGWQDDSTTANPPVGRHPNDPSLRGSRKGVRRISIRLE